jgi:hypothetical protein
MAQAWADVLDILAEKYPQAFFAGMVAMTKESLSRPRTHASSGNLTHNVMDKQVVQLPAKAMFCQAVPGVLIASILLGTSILTSFAQNDDSEFFPIRFGMVP